jgi:hypothetical protein
MEKDREHNKHEATGKKIDQEQLKALQKMLARMDKKKNN